MICDEIANTTLLFHIVSISTWRVLKTTPNQAEEQIIQMNIFLESKLVCTVRPASKDGLGLGRRQNSSRGRRHRPHFTTQVTFT